MLTVHLIEHAIKHNKNIKMYSQKIKVVPDFFSDLSEASSFINRKVV
jgi:hypothetical protein